MFTQNEIKRMLSESKKEKKKKDTPPGVTWNKDSSMWHARIQIDGQSIHLGFYEDKQEAIAIRKEAERDHGFSGVRNGRRKNSRNTSGIMGVCFNKNAEKWESYIRIKYEKIHLGLFEDMEDAVEARLKAEEKYRKKLKIHP